MTPPPIPLIFEPIFKPKPWGGQSLAQLFGKVLPSDTPIGESWELSDLPGEVSRVARGPLTGRTLHELVRIWGQDLVGGAQLVAERFPLLIKFLDARENLSVQLHPKPSSGPFASGQPCKNEAWYVVAAQPGAAVLVALKPGVGPEQARRAAGTPAFVDLLVRRVARPGEAFYLPSGVPHGLGAGLVVAEVEMPSDVTYRLYDWDRLGLDGRSRELHLEPALANLRNDVTEAEIVQPRSHAANAWITTTRLAACDQFLLDKLRLSEGLVQALPHLEMLIWIVLQGRGALTRDRFRLEFRPGDVVLIPAGARGTRVETATDCVVLEVSVPIPSPRSP